MSKDKNILVVDLDGTLIRSDLLHESFWSAIGINILNMFRAVIAALQGRAQLKQFLYENSDIDVALLPYNDHVIAYIDQHRKNGGYTALVTAANFHFAEKINQHLRLFDEVKGSTATANLKGKMKADYLVSRFGENGFSYIGDANADLTVWKTASKAIAVNARSGLRKKIEALGKPHDYIHAAEPVWPNIFKALRLHQWLKNILVFLPMLASHQITGAHILSSAFAFVVFSLFASSIYVLNDLVDMSADRQHPRKRFRPFASGGLPANYGIVLLFALLALASMIAAVMDPAILLLMLLYVLINLAYSTKLKQVATLDIMTLSGLYCLRIWVGGVATGIDISFWLIVFSLFFFLSLAAIKRQAELVDIKARGVADIAGRGYTVNDLPIMTISGLGAGYLAVLVMALYINSPEVNALYNMPSALLGVCLILIYWLTRLVLITNHGGMTDDPIIFAMTDRTSHVCLGLITAIVVSGAIW